MEVLVRAIRREGQTISPTDMHAKSTTTTENTLRLLISIAKTRASGGDYSSYAHRFVCPVVVEILAHWSRRNLTACALFQVGLFVRPARCANAMKPSGL